MIYVNLLCILNIVFIKKRVLKVKYLMILICLLFAGLLSWNASNCHVNLEEELNTITIQALDGEEGKNGKWKSCGIQQISLTFNKAH